MWCVCVYSSNNNNKSLLDLPSTDVRLDSFCAYLLKNQDKERVSELCLLEQFSLPGLYAQNDQVTTLSIQRLQI